MNTSYLNKLHDSAGRLIGDESVVEIIAHLKETVGRSEGPFVWTVIEPLPGGLPENIRSVWIFVLKSGVPSGCHYHPNSVQHMAVVEGSGRSVVAGRSREMLEYANTGHPLEDIWYVIEPGEEHEFFPEGGDMVVISFHTCEAHELEEINASGERRFYESEK